MQISLTNLAAMHKILKNIWTKVRLVSLININTKEWQNKPPFMKVVYSKHSQHNWQIAQTYETAQQGLWV